MLFKSKTKGSQKLEDVVDDPDWLDSNKERIAKQ